MSIGDAINMTDRQRETVNKYVTAWEPSGWRITVEPLNDKVIVSAVGGPRAMRSVWVNPDGTVSSGMMA